MKVVVSGVASEKALPKIADFASLKDQIIVVCSNMERAKRLKSDLSFFVRDKEILILPPSDSFFFRDDARSRDDILSRLKIYKKLSSGEKVVVISPVSSFILKLPPKEVFNENKINLKLGEEYSLNEVKEKISLMGYERVTLVDSKGEFSLRGGILDIYTPDGNNPYRVEFFGDEIDSIREIDIDTQRSISKLNEITIYPSTLININDTLYSNAIGKIEKEYDKAIEKSKDSKRDQLIKTKNETIEMIKEIKNPQFLNNYLHYFYDKPSYIWDYMNDGVIQIDDTDRIYERLDGIDKDNQNDFNYLLDSGRLISKDFSMFCGTEDFKKCLDYSLIVFYTQFGKMPRYIENYDRLINKKVKDTIQYFGKIDIFISDLKSYIKNKYEVTIISQTTDRIDNIKNMLSDNDVFGVNIEKGILEKGFIDVEDKKVWISENDIFGKVKKEKKNKFNDKTSKRLESFSDLNIGDYVVHINHGIGKFSGIVKQKFHDKIGDYIKIQYQGTDILYVPVENLDSVQKYIGGRGENPRLNSLSGNEWRNTKERARKEIMLMAKDLIDLYAKRQISNGFSFSPDTIWQDEFEASFPFIETDDQLQAIEEIKHDMEKPNPMDRLLLGDVGFGKTEVAARACFKALNDGKQAAILVPTTILASQHYQTLKERFEKFPFKVELLCRFKTKKEQDEIVKKLANGEVDLVIGTHRLISEDIKFKDLGLLVIDEEQRFGVQAKEKLKKLKESVDCLTLSATPIPRTLNMSLSGIKDMSLLLEPPVDRYPVQTYVIEDDDLIIKEAIQKELDRGGQVYVVFNRINGINFIKSRIEKLVPDAKIAIGHGRLSEERLEDVIEGFINCETNVLISTSIIESGIDIPNANTMIVLDSQRYGLSDLYQLRGRVGRSDRIAHCYLMYKKDTVLTEKAEKRLQAIKEFTEFGSGFKIAMRDLEIRGAGNLLGEAQSGHIDLVGYELYVKMIGEAVRTLQGETNISDDELDSIIDLPVSQYIPDKYIEDEVTKMEVYKKIASIKSTMDEDDILDELIDRFGDIPEVTINLIKISHIRYLAQKLGATHIYKDEEDSFNNKVKGILKVKIDFQAKNNLKPIGLSEAQSKYDGKIILRMGKVPSIKLTTDNKEMLNDVLSLLEILFCDNDESMI